MANEELKEMERTPLEAGYYLTTDDVCAYLRIRRTKLYELIDVGEIKRVKIGRAARIPAESVIEYKQRLEANT
jgi:excisionase family DNA binding protein